MFGSIGMTELIVIMVVALIVIGPQRLPDLAKTLGRAFRDFKRATSDFQSSLSLEDDEDLDVYSESIEAATKEEKKPTDPETVAQDDVVPDEPTDPSNRIDPRPNPESGGESSDSAASSDEPDNTKGSTPEERAEKA